MHFIKEKTLNIKASKQRAEMVQALNIKHLQVKDAMLSVPRHKFVDEALSRHAYQNITLPIGFSQTISQPIVIAKMTETLISANYNYNSVLEIGTGCGYQSAILAKLFTTVYSIERIYDLHISAKERLKNLGFDNIHCYHSDGSNISEEQKFDAIIITAAADKIPEHIINSLAINGRLIAPEGKQNTTQKLIKITFDGENFSKQILDYVQFVPLLTGVI